MQNKMEVFGGSLQMRVSRNFILQVWKPCIKCKTQVALLWTPLSCMFFPVRSKNSEEQSCWYHQREKCGGCWQWNCAVAIFKSHIHNHYQVCHSKQLFLLIIVQLAGDKTKICWHWKQIVWLEWAELKIYANQLQIMNLRILFWCVILKA